MIIIIILLISLANGISAIPHEQPPSDILVLNHVINDTMCQQLMHFGNDSVTRVAISSTESLKPWDMFLFSVFGQAFQQYVLQYNVFYTLEKKDIGYNLMVRTKDNKDLKPNFASTTPKLLVGAIIFLNDNVAGGQLHFPRQNKKIDPECGRFVVFPNSHVFPYAFYPVKLGQLYYVGTYFY